MKTTPEEWGGEVARMARSLAYQWPGVAEDDIYQEMMLTLVERWESVSGSPRLALGLARKRGVQYCSQERTEYQLSSAQWIYTPAEVRRLLPHLWSETAWEDAPKRPSKGKDYLEADGISILLMDMKAAFEAVAEQHQSAILSAFRDGGETLSATERKRVSRAIDAVTAVLNRQVYRETVTDDHEGPGARHVQSNAAARYQTANDY